MKIRYSALLLTAALTLGLSACGGASSSTASSAASSVASSAASSSAAASSEANASQTVSPLPAFSITDPMEDGIYAASIQGVEKTDNGYQLTAVLAGYDQYDMVDVSNLKPGDIIITHTMGGSADSTEEITVETVENSDGIITINGGIEEGGLYLKEEDTVYRTMEMDDYPGYYAVGTTDPIKLADDVVFSDGTADFGAEPVETVGAEAAAEKISAGETSLTYYNTTIRVESGEVAEITAVWVP